MHKCRKNTLVTYQKILEFRANSFFLLLEKKDTGEFSIYKPELKSFWHPKFANNYLKNRMTKMLKTIEIHKYKMFTLTYDINNYTAEEVAKRHKSDFKKLVRMVRKNFGKFEYAYFIEPTKNFYLHFHVYTETYIPQKWLSERWKEITGSYIVKIKLIRNQKQKIYACGYQNVAKKFTHEQLEFCFHNVSRLFGASRHFFDKIKNNIKYIPLYNKIKMMIIKQKNIIEALKVEKQTKGIHFRNSALEDIMQYCYSLGTVKVTEKCLIVSNKPIRNI